MVSSANETGKGGRQRSGVCATLSHFFEVAWRVDHGPDDEAVKTD